MFVCLLIRPTLLIFDKNEPLAQTLSERMAFLLSSDPPTRQTLSRMLKKFYDARSIVVHGNRKEAKKLSPDLLEAVDRLAVLCYLILAANGALWETTDFFRKWCESQRWGVPATNINIPFSEKYLKSAMTLFEKEI